MKALKDNVGNILFIICVYLAALGLHWGLWDLPMWRAVSRAQAAMAVQWLFTNTALLDSLKT